MAGGKVNNFMQPYQEVDDVHRFLKGTDVGEVEARSLPEFTGDLGRGKKFTSIEFEGIPVTQLVGGGAATGTAGDENNMIIDGENFHYHINGTQTAMSPVAHADGLDVGMDQTENDGAEFTQGITSGSKSAFTVGTSAAFYGKCSFSIANVSGTDDCAFGFRKAEAFQGAIDNYDEMACLNVISGDIKIETILNGNATVTTDTTDDWADAGEHTLEVYVSADGVVTYQIDGAAPTVTAAFTFDADEVVIPFFYYLHAADPEAGSIVLTKWEVGYQADLQ